MTRSREEQLRNELAVEEARLGELEKRRAQAASRVEALRRRLGELPSARAGVPSGAQATDKSGPLTSVEKLALFRRRFRGREDVFARRWENAKSGRSGYAPACSNEWVSGICEKPRVRCSECSHQAFLPVDDEAILDHFRGRHVLGIYPLLRDETCRLLAADFDGSAWRDDVSAFVETCRHFDLSPLIERSRSGNGAHAWFFFDEPVPAATARNLGSLLITETMSRRHQLPMTSYDRLFPSQETLPRGGFGNLIALPFQDGPRQAGNTVFVGDDFTPFSDQWKQLACAPSISHLVAESLATDAVRRDRVLGLPSPDDVEDERVAPWERRPSRRSPAVRVTEPLPETVSAVLAQQLFVEKVGLPSPVINQIKRLAAFQNPEFYKKQRMRLSTALTPRVISCAEDLPSHVALPRGCRSELEDLLSDYGVGLVLRDERVEAEGAAFEFNGQLTPAQAPAAETLLAHDIGVFVAPPGSGKTVVGVYVISRRKQATLILVHRQPLLEQWKAQLSLFLGIKEKEIGQIGAGKSKPNGRLDVAMIQSLVRKDRVRDLVADYGQVIVDECHHVPAVSFERVLCEAKARYVVGLTGTLRRRDGHHPIVQMQCGPVRYEINTKGQADRRPFDHRLLVRETTFQVDEATMESGIQSIYARMATDEDRNRQIVDDVLMALEEGRSPILLTERKDHLEALAAWLKGFVRNQVVLKGGMTRKERRAVAEELAAIGEDEKRLLLATGRYIGEGFDDARLDTLFLAMPVSWKGTLVQYVGRLHRNHSEKSEVLVYDYVDRQVPMLARMFDKRLKAYRAMGYSLAIGTPTAAEPGGTIV